MNNYSISISISVSNSLYSANSHNPIYPNPLILYYPLPLDLSFEKIISNLYSVVLTPSMDSICQLS